jgi:hypothetical protein
VTVGQRGDEWDGESQGLTGAGPAPAEHVASGQRVWQREGLDREGCSDTAAGERVGQLSWYTEGSEGDARGGGAGNAVVLGAGSIERFDWQN